MVTQILNFGIPAQIDVRTVGYDRANNLRSRQGAAAPDRRYPGHRRRPSAAGGRRAGLLRRDRPRARRAVRPHREQHRHQPQYQPELLGAGDAEFLDRSRANGMPYYLAVQTPEHRDQLAQRPQEHAGRRTSRSPTRQPGAGSARATSRRSSATRSRPTPTKPTFSRSTRSIANVAGPRSRHVSRATSTRSSPSCRSSSRPATASRCSARSRA